MRPLSLLAILLPALAWPADLPPGRYLEVARAFVDTMMARGTDRYGATHSPLFAAMLDLNTMALPNPSPPEEFFRGRGGQIQSIGFGLPNPPVGVRPGDRAPLGNNLEHDIMLLQSMFKLSELTGDRKYADHAGAYLRFWLLHCQSPATGLMAAGEHMSWDFVRDEAHADVHEVFRRFPLYDRLYAIDPYRALRIADALWLSQMGNKKVGDFSRHAGYSSYRTATGAAYPRHAGFYIWAYANAYVQSRDPKYIERIEVLIESRTGKRPRPESQLVELGAFQPERSTDPTLRALLWDAAELVPQRKADWRRIVRELDEEALRQPRSRAARRLPPEVDPKRRQEAEQRYPGLLRHNRTLGGGLQTVSTTLSPLWVMAYGSSGASGAALLHLTRYQQTRDERFLRLAEEIADQYLAEGLPKATQDLWPRACGQVVSLLLALGRENGMAAEKRQRYWEFARSTTALALGLFSKNGLFRADGVADHYEAITGADDLLWALLQLHCQLNKPELNLGHIDVNW